MQLGQKVKTTARLDRRHRPTNPEYKGGSWNRKQWERTDHPEKEGVFIGTRTLQNGVREYDCDSGWCWYKDSHFEAALVVFDKRQAPVHVPLDAISTVES